MSSIGPLQGNMLATAGLDRVPTAPPPPPGPDPLSIYDVLRRLISGQPWNEDERREAFALIGKLELNGVLGNRAAEILTDPSERGK